MNFSLFPMSFSLLTKRLFDEVGNYVPYRLHSSENRNTANMQIQCLWYSTRKVWKSYAWDCYCSVSSTTSKPANTIRLPHSPKVNGWMRQTSFSISCINTMTDLEALSITGARCDSHPLHTLITTKPYYMRLAHGAFTGALSAASGALNWQLWS